MPAEFRIQVDASGPRMTWGGNTGVPEGSDFDLVAQVTLNGALPSGLLTSSGTWTLTVSDSVLNAGVALLTDRASDSFATTTGKARWSITDSQSSAWEAGVYGGDIKLVDSGGIITYWPISMKVRGVKD